MKPSPGFTKRLKRIDRDLSAKWNGAINRWGIYHDLPSVERIEDRVKREGLELQADLAKRGYMSTRRVCEEQVFRQLHEAALVFYVAEKDGSFAPLDDRVIQKLMRMDFWRRNFGINDWKRYMDNQRAILESDRVRELEGIYQAIDRDKVGKQMVVDALRGDPHSRAVYVEQPDKPSRISIVEK